MWPDASETEQLLESARRGDPDARGRLLERHRDALRRMIGLRIDPAARPARRCQRHRARRALGGGSAAGRLSDGGQNAVSFVAAPPRATALIDAHRHHRRAARRSLDREQPLPQVAWSDQSAVDLADLVRDRRATPAAAAMGRELELRLPAALDQLDETDREVVLLRHFEQMSNGEIAEVLGLKRAAGMRYLRAMRRLRSLLDEVPSQKGTR